MAVWRTLLHAGWLWIQLLGLSIGGVIVLEVLPSFLEKPTSRWRSVLHDYLISSRRWLSRWRLILLALSFVAVLAYTITNPPPPGDRRILGSERRHMIHALSGAVSKSDFEVKIWAEDAYEPYQLAEDIQGVLLEAGWTVYSNPPIQTCLVMSSSGPPASGIEIGIHGEKLPPPSEISLPSDHPALGLYEAFKRLGFLCYFDPKPGLDENIIEICVMQHEKPD